MRVAVVAHPLRAAGGLSVGRNIVSSLARVGPENTYLFILPANVGYEAIGLDVSRHQVVYYRRRGGHFGRYLFDVFRVKAMIRRFHPDVVLCLANQGAGIHSCPQAILCHDPHLFYPVKHFARETFAKKLVKAFMRWRLGRDLRFTQLLLCQTSVAQARLVAAFDYRGKTSICPNALSELTMGGAASDEVPPSLRPYAEKFRLLCLTRYYPHKNIEGIVELFRKCRSELRDVVVFLTISADQHVKAGRLLRTVARLGLSDSIVNVGPLHQQELAAYYRNCHGLFLPTLLESFSGSYVEAMHFGTPIITSDLDFAREVCGDAAIYANPWDVDAMKNAILALKSSPQRAQELVLQGKARAVSAARSWDGIAGALLQDLHDMVSKP